MIGGLIQMNAHMVISSTAHILMGFGSATAIVFAFVAFCTVIAAGKAKVRWTLFFLVLALMGAVAATVGAKMPREKIIAACADGPVSLEQVVAVYDIVEIDGKLLKLRER